MWELLETFRSRTPLAFGYGEEKFVLCLSWDGFHAAFPVDYCSLSHTQPGGLARSFPECWIPMWGVWPEILDHKPSILTPPIQTPVRKMARKVRFYDNLAL